MIIVFVTVVPPCKTTRDEPEVERDSNKDEEEKRKKQRGRSRKEGLESYFRNKD